MSEKTLERAADAIADVVYRFDQLAGATSALAHAQALVALQNAVSDLASWHPDYDDEEQRIRGLYDDDDEGASHGGIAHSVGSVAGCADPYASLTPDTGMRRNTCTISKRSSAAAVRSS